MKIYFLLIVSYLLHSNLHAQPIQPLIDSLETLLEKHKIPGLMVSIVKKDTVLFTGGIGYADEEKKEKVTAAHLFRVGSISKSFTALGILRLVQSGKLDLSDKVMDIDPLLPIINPWKREAPITIANILEHTAGLDDMHFHGVYNTEDLSTPPLKKVLLKHKTSLTARWRPGTRMSYSNVGYILAGYIIEKVSGMPFHEYMKKEVMEPLGMGQSCFYFHPPDESVLQSKGYKYKNGKYVIERHIPLNGTPAGGLCTNAADMEKLLQWMLKEERPEHHDFLSEELLSRMEYPETNLATKAGLPYGYGLANVTSWKNNYTFHGHNGGSRDADLAVAISVNRLVSPSAFLEVIYDYFITDKKQLERKRIQIIPAEIAEKFQGFYTNQSPRFESNVFIDQVTEGIYLNFDKDHLVVTDMFGELLDTLWYAGNLQFYSENNPAPTNILLESEKDIPALWSWGIYYQKSSSTYQWLRFNLITLSLVSLIAYLIYGVFWGLLRWWKGRKTTYLTRLILWLACIGFMMIPFGLGLTLLDMTNANKINFAGLSFFSGSISWFVLSIISVFLSFRHRHESQLFQVYYGLTAFLVCGFSFYLLYHNVIGLKMWNY